MSQIYKKSTNSRPFRRRLATESGTKFDLKKTLPKIFKAFDLACELYKKEVVHTPQIARARAFEASLMNSKMIQAIQEYFPENWSFGKYKRFILRIDGYIILFKKLDKKNRPMNIKTKSVEAIAQQLSLPLFNETQSFEEPILFFGYRKDKMGSLIDPKIVYLDEGKIKWVITSKDIDQSNVESNPIVVTPTPSPASPSPVSPTWKKQKGDKKQAG